MYCVYVYRVYISLYYTSTPPPNFAFYRLARIRLDVHREEIRETPWRRLIICLTRFLMLLKTLVPKKNFFFLVSSHMCPFTSFSLSLSLSLEVKNALTNGL